MSEADEQDRKFRERVAKEVAETEQYVTDLRDKLIAWGFSPSLDECAWNVIHESGYFISPHEANGQWTAELRPRSEYDKMRLQASVEALERELKWGFFRHGEDKNEHVLALAKALSTAATESLKQHGDLRDALNEMARYAERAWNHPNHEKRGDLYKVLDLYVSANERYKDSVKEHSDSATPETEWLDEGIRSFRAAAEVYVSTKNAHAPWLTNRIAASLLQPYIVSIKKASTRFFPATRWGATYKEPWCVIVPLVLALLLFVASVAVVVACYLLLGPLWAAVAGGLCLLMYARRYREMANFRKEKAKLIGLGHKLAVLHDEVDGGAYNVEETIRRFKELEKDDLWLPSTFASVVAIHGNENKD
jgi:hypothetical protein